MHPFCQLLKHEVQRINRGCQQKSKWKEIQSEVFNLEVLRVLPESGLMQKGIISSIGSENVNIHPLVLVMKGTGARLKDVYKA